MPDRIRNTSRLVDKLIAKSHVCGETCLSDRRRDDIALTKKGNALSAKFKVIMEQNMDSLQEVWSSKGDHNATDILEAWNDSQP